MDSIEGKKQPKSNNQIESLRLILEHEQHHSFSYEEAREVGNSLMTFYEVLAEEVAPYSTDADDRGVN